MEESSAQLALERRIVEAFVEALDQRIASTNGSAMLRERRVALEKLRTSTIELWPYILKK